VAGAGRSVTPGYTPPMIVVHHLENSRSQRVLWLLEELGVPYEVKRYARDPKTMLAPPELRAVHPLGKSPIVVDEGIVYAESGAILEHLAERYGALWLGSGDAEERRRVRFFLHYAEGSLMPLLLMTLVFRKLPRAPMPFFIRPIARGLAMGAMSGFVSPQLNQHLRFIESELQGRAWLAGDSPTIADVQVSFALEGANVRAGLAAYPRLTEYLARIRARPAYARALERGGPFSLE
jgi:glutathione S-transferase